ncbi:MAG: hypothetical protein ABSB32_14865 [Thermodesulfobacteriota bacterium]
MNALRLTIYVFGPYPKASINPIIIPRPVLRYGLQVKPQVLPKCVESKFSPYPIAAPTPNPRKTLNTMPAFTLS